jgi:hypothetical protein
MKIAARRPTRGKTAVKSVAFAWPIAENSTGKTKIDRNASSLTKM